MGYEGLGRGGVASEDVLLQVRNRYFPPGAILHLYACSALLAEADNRRQCCHRNEANRQNGLADQRIDQG